MSTCAPFFDIHPRTRTGVRRSSFVKSLKLIALFCVITSCISNNVDGFVRFRNVGSSIYSWLELAFLCCFFSFANFARSYYSFCQDLHRGLIFDFWFYPSYHCYQCYFDHDYYLSHYSRQRIF